MTSDFCITCGIMGFDYTDYVIIVLIYSTVNTNSKFSFLVFNRKLYIFMVGRSDKVKLRVVRGQFTTTNHGM